MHFELLAAIDETGGLAKNDKLPWSGTAAGKIDMCFFREFTAEGAVIMGRRTWDNLPYKPLRKRLNIVITRDLAAMLPMDNVIYVSNFEAALTAAGSRYPRVVIGGRQIYQLALHHPCLIRAHINQIPGNYDCDLRFPCELLPTRPKPLPIGEGVLYHVYDFTNHEEIYFRNLLTAVSKCPLRPSRTGVNTRSSFHQNVRFELTDPRGRVLPLLTTKEVRWAAIYHELIWFLRGSTDTKYLEENGVHIWAGNSSRKYLDSRGLVDYPVGSVGPIYGKQWRDWAGIDQLAGVIDGIKKDPWGRRHLVSAWNVADLPKMCLPPCHQSFQFHVDPDDAGRPARLNCLVNMRSADLALGVPFNIASYAFLTHIVAFLTGLTGGTLSISMADCHIYENHLAQVAKWTGRQPFRFPIIQFGPAISAESSLDDFAKKFTISDFEIQGYKSHPFLKLPMAV